jgi:hypothetical protein
MDLNFLFHLSIFCQYISGGLGVTFQKLPATICCARFYNGMKETTSENLGVDRRIILKLILMKCDGRIWAASC